MSTSSVLPLCVVIVSWNFCDNPFTSTLRPLPLIYGTTVMHFVDMLLNAARAGRYAVQTFTVALRLSHSEQFVSMLSCQTARKIPATLLGSMTFGGRVDADTSANMAKVFLERGHNELDTAFMYTDGNAETVIGAMQLPQTGRTGKSARI